MAKTLIALKELRKQNKMTQAGLAEIMNVSQATITYWEQGKREPSCEDLKKLADVFNVSLDYLLNRNNDVHYSSLSKEQEKLLSDFKSLSKGNKQIILNMIAAFLTQQAAKVFGNIINTNSGSGNFFGGNNYFSF